MTDPASPAAVSTAPAKAAPAPLDDAFFARLSTGPGVYVMKDADDRVLYVGKALNLRNRVRSYFRDGGDGRLFIPFLRSRVVSIETILTDTEKEALLLENTLIKKHKPRYNIRLRDDKTYVSLRLDTTHQWPRLHRTRRRRAGDRALYFGPYASASAVKETIRFLQRLFPLRSCGDRELTNRVRPCILHQIDRCSAPCVGRVEAATYAEYVQQTMLFLKGREDDVQRLLTAKMMEYSEAMAFEKAALVRDRLRAIKATVEEEKVHSHRAFDRDVVGVARGGGRVFFAVLMFRRGRLEVPDVFDVKDTDLDEPELLEGFLSQFYDTTREVPRDVLVAIEPTGAEFLTALLAGQRGSPVRLHAPQRGHNRRLVEMATQNAKAALDRHLAGARTIHDTLVDLQLALQLPRVPRIIECLDISNFQGSFPVGSLTRFVDGEPDKARYRRFKIKEVEGQNDFAMIREVLGRHFARLANEPDTDWPDLMVIDGGIGQLNSALEVFGELKLLDRLPVVGLAKARTFAPSRTPGFKDKPSRSEERVFLPGRKNPVTFRRSDAALHVLERLRDETHRFGVAYHRLLRGRAALKSGLEDIEGVGPKRRGLLLRALGSLAKIKAASIDELAAVDGVPRAVAEKVHAFFHAAPAPAPAADEANESIEGEALAGEALDAFEDELEDEDANDEDDADE